MSQTARLSVGTAATAAPPGTGSRRRTILGLAVPAALFLLGLALPPEASVNLGGLRISPYRFVLLAIIVPSLLRLFGGHYGKVLPADWLILAHGCWAGIALINYAGPEQGVITGGIYFIEAVGAYLVGRVYVRSAKDFEIYVRFFMLMLAGMLVFTIPEALTGSHPLRDIFKAVMGGPGAHYMEPRLGLNRAFGPFDHPIIYGVFCATGFAACYYVLGKGRIGLRTMFFAGIAFVSTFISVSAGPFVSLFAQIALIGWDRITRGIPYRWTILVGLALVSVGLISALSNRPPINVFLSYGTFSAQSAYNRLRIWEYGNAEIERNPLLGIGLGEWERASWMRSSSMDNFWLATAVRYGLPALIFLAAAIYTIARAQGRRRNLGDADARFRTAWIVTLVGLAVAAWTVHFWNAVFCLLFFHIGCGAWLARPPPGRTAPQPRVVAPLYVPRSTVSP